MQLSVIIPAKNEAANLPELLRVLREQQGVEMEVIVADAHSDDETRVIAERYGARVVEGGMPGPGRNAGARVAQGEWLCFHDADVMPFGDTWYRDVLVRLEKSKADVATVRLVPEKGGFLNWLYHVVYHLFAQASSPWIAHAPGSCIFVRRAWHERISGFDESVIFAEDMEYAQRLQRAGARFVYLGDVPLRASVRRLERDGHAHIAWRYMRAEWYMRMKGPIRKELFPYEFTYPAKRS